MRTAKSSPGSPAVFTTYDIGRMTGTDPTTVHKWIDRGLLRGYRTPGGHRRVRSEDLRTFLAAHKMPIPRELGGNGALRVLLADGDAGELRSLGRSLRRLKPSWQVDTVASGVEALLSASREPPDVLVLDLHLPELDGFSVCKHLAARPDTASVKLVALVSRVTAEIERKAKVAGARTVLKKSASGAELVEIIEVAAGVQPAAETA